MANELWAVYPTGATIYAIIRKQSDKEVWNGTDFETWADANIATYDVELAYVGSAYYSVDFPIGITDEDTYHVTFHVRATGAPLITDNAIYVAKVEWDGSAEITLTVLNDAVNTLNAQGSRVNNVYGPGE